MFIFTFRLFVLFLILSLSPVFAQGLNSDLSKIGSLAGKAYISPIVTNVGVNLNSGWLNTAPANEKFGFDLEFGIVGMYSSFSSDANNRFSVDGTFRFSRSQLLEITKDVTDAAVREDVINQLLVRDMPVRIYGATINGYELDKIKVLFGPNGDEVVDVNAAIPVQVVLPSKEIDLGVGGLFNGLKNIPGVAPQLKIGTLLGTRAIIRMVPEIKIGDSIGTFSYFGFGLEHNVAYWLDPITGKLPVDITVGFLTQTAKLDKSAAFSATTYGLNVSSKFSLLGWLDVTPYAGFMLESSKLSVDISKQIDTPNGQETAKISFDVEGENSSRFVIGASFRMTFINLNFEYAAAKANTLLAGLSFKF